MFFYLQHIAPTTALGSHCSGAFIPQCCALPALRAEQATHMLTKKRQDGFSIPAGPFTQHS
jgi:hypothetical protein